MRPCTRKDFADIGAEEIYNKHADNDLRQYLICADKTEEFELFNFEMSYPSKQLDFTIMTCAPFQRGAACKQDEELEDYLGTFGVDVFVA